MTAPTEDLTGERSEALALAVELHKRFFIGEDAARVCSTATTLFGWLTGPVALVITAGPAVDQTTGQLTGNPGGKTMQDTEKMPLTVTAQDAKGQVTASGTDITFTSADTTIASISTDANGVVWVIAGNPGSTVITADWPDSPSGDLQGTLAVDVTAGAATSLVVTAGAPVPQ